MNTIILSTSLFDCILSKLDQNSKHHKDDQTFHWIAKSLRENAISDELDVTVALHKAEAALSAISVNAERNSHLYNAALDKLIIAELSALIEARKSELGSREASN